MQSEQTDAEPDPGSGRFVPWTMASGTGMSEEELVEGDGEGMMEGATFLGGMPPPGLGRPTAQEEVGEEMGVEGAQTGQNAGKRRRVEDGV